MKRRYEIREVLVKISFIGAMQLFATIGIALARDDPPPSSVRPWAPPALPKYEGELRHYKLTEAERHYYPAIDPRKTYNLAELIDIAQRSNPETRVAWERARQAAAAVGLTESAYYPYLVAAAAGGYDRAFIPFPTLRVKQQTPLTNGNSRVRNQILTFRQASVRRATPELLSSRASVFCRLCRSKWRTCQRKVIGIVRQKIPSVN